MQALQSAQTFLLEAQRYENLSIYRDAEGEALYMSMNARPRPCFSWSLVQDVLTFQKRFAATVSSGPMPPRCLVWASENQSIFSLGGDLDLFQSLISTHDRKALHHYAEGCVDGLYNHMMAPDVVTVSILEGDALGAGFEVALSSDIVIAECGVRAGFPEVLFNLVPGHGAFYLLSRRIGPRAAEKMIRDGGVHTAEELHALGLIDILVSKGEGRQALRELLQKQRKSWNSFQALQHIKRHHQPITREALMASASIWVDAAMRLTDRNLRMMERLVNAQGKRVGLATPEAETMQQEVCQAVAA